jgi:hypothetical protein
VNTTTESAARRAGVWDADAPDGYVALVVYGLSGRRLLRIEIATEAYSPAWIGYLERWLRRAEGRFLRILR